MDDDMKKRPKLGDRVEFKYHRSSRIGNIIAVSKETDSHFLIETPFNSNMVRKPWESELKLLRIGIDAIIKILPSESS
jgi:hypothetical protein